MLLGFGGYPIGGSAGVVKLTTWNLSDTNFGGISRCGVTFQTNGNVTRIGDTGTIPDDEWWTTQPETDIGLDYDVRYTSITGSWNLSAAALNVWIQISAARTWRISVASKASPSLKSISNVSFEIRLTGSGSALDSNVNCTFSAEN